MEHEPRDEDNINERLIPEIPGVSIYDDDDWGSLAEEPREESEDDVLREISSEELRERKKILETYGVEGLNTVSEEAINHLWERMGMSGYLVADLALKTTLETQSMTRNELRWPKFRDLQQRSEVVENPYDIRVQLVEALAPNLEGIGYPDFKSTRLLLRSNEDLAKAFKVEGWLAGLFFMKDLPDRLKSEIAAEKDRRIKQGKVFKVTLEEVVRQARIAESQEVRDSYDFRLTTALESYDQLLKTLRNSYRIASDAFAKFIVR